MPKAPRTTRKSVIARDLLDRLIIVGCNYIVCWPWWYATCGVDKDRRLAPRKRTQQHAEQRRNAWMSRRKFILHP